MLTNTNSQELPTPQLGQLLMQAQQWITLSLLNLMAVRGHQQLTAAHLMFLNNLDCGTTHASEVARRMGVTRQAVFRSTRELQKLGVLKLETDAMRKTQKIIRMTDQGLKVVSDARACLAKIEKTLEKRLGKKDLNSLSTILIRDWQNPL